MRNYPDFISAFMEYTKHVAVPEKFLRWSCLSIIAGALERKVWIDFREQAFCYPNQYICLVGASGLSKKSFSSRQAVRIIQEIEGVTFGGTQMTTAGLIDDLMKTGSVKKFEYKGQTYSHSALYIYTSEATVTLKGDMQNMLIQNLTDLYDGGPEGWNQTAAWKKRLKNEETKIYNPCINLLACSTPVWLVDAIGEENLESGFASRILFVVHKGRPKRSSGWKKAESMKHMKGKLTEDLIEINYLQGPYATTQCFRDAFDELEESNNCFLEKHPDHSLTGYYARKLWHTMKLSQVLQASKSDEMIVTGEIFREAKELIESLEGEMENAFENIVMKESGKLLLKVWNFVRGLEDPVLPTDLIRAKFAFEEEGDITKAINQLRILKKVGNLMVEGRICIRVLDPTPIE